MVGRGRRRGGSLGREVGILAGFCVGGLRTIRVSVARVGARGAAVRGRGS